MSRNVPLQILRAMAAAIVVYEHAITTYSEKILTLDSLLSFEIGIIGVEIFFAISGFIIYKSTESIKPSLDSSANFMGRRLVRIFPIYAVATIVYSLKLFLEGVPPSEEAIIQSLLFYPYIDNSNGLMRPVLGVGWSLNYEILFYAILAIAIMFVKEHRMNITIFLIVLFLLLGFVTTPTREEGASGYTLLSTSWMFYFLLGLVMAHYSSSFQLSRYYVSTGFIISLMSVIIVSYVCFSMFMVADRIAVLVGGLVLSSVCLFLCINAPNSDNSNLLVRLLVLCGDASYSTYLFHSFILGVSGRLVGMSGIHLSHSLFATIMVVVTAVGGIMVFHFVERPITRKCNNGLKYTNEKLVAFRQAL